MKPGTRLLCILLSAASVLTGCSKHGPEARGTHPAREPVRTPSHGPSDPLSAGDDLPAVSALAQTGARVTIERARQRPLLLFFCDSIRSERCSALARVLSARWSRLRALNAEVIGVARNYRALVRAVAYDARLPFYVLADPQGKIFRAFGLMQGGTVFVVDTQGEIRQRLSEAPPSELGERAVQLVAELPRTSG
ncbi:MAG: redoxin domain-containing protein [Polyangiaceae bacterium]|nr:redoxin domain-containing protein [Polyangiaceae bacterium]